MYQYIFAHFISISTSAWLWHGWVGLPWPWPGSGTAGAGALHCGLAIAGKRAPAAAAAAYWPQWRFKHQLGTQMKKLSTSTRALALQAHAHAHVQYVWAPCTWNAGAARAIHCNPGCNAARASGTGCGYKRMLALVCTCWRYWLTVLFYKCIAAMAMGRAMAPAHPHVRCFNQHLSAA